MIVKLIIFFQVKETFENHQTEFIKINEQETIELKCGNHSLLQENNELKKQNEWFKEQFKLANQRHFGKSSETAHSLNLSLFDEAMSGNQTKDEVALPTNETITYTRKKKSGKVCKTWTIPELLNFMIKILTY